MTKQFIIAVKEVVNFLNESFERYDDSDNSAYQTFPDFINETYNITLSNDSPISWYDEKLIFDDEIQYNWFLLQWK